MSGDPLEMMVLYLQTTIKLFMKLGLLTDDFKKFAGLEKI